MTDEHTIPGRYDRIAEVCQRVMAGAEEAGFDADDLFQIELACDEACTNVIEHAYGEEDAGEILVAWRFDRGAFIITISDKGKAFNPNTIPETIVPTDPADMDDLQIGGLGIHFMRKLMDEIHFSFDEGGGNRLVMVKYRADGENDEH